MEGSSIVPDSVMESVKRTLSHVEEVGLHFHQFLSLSDPDLLAESPPLERAQSLLLLARATTTLFTGMSLVSFAQFSFSSDLIVSFHVVLC